MIGWLLSIATLGSLSPGESCEWNRSELKNESSAWLVYSDLPSRSTLPTPAEVYWLSIDEVMVPLPAADYQRVLVAVSDGEMSIVTLSDRDQSHQVYLTRMTQDPETDGMTSSLMDRWVAGYAITPDDIDCEGSRSDWMHQLILMQVKALGYPGGEDQQVFRLPHGWLRTGHAQGQLRSFSTYSTGSGDLLDVQWRLPDDHTGLLPIYLKPPEQATTTPPALEQFADCIADWSVTCLEQLDALEVGVFTRENDT